jgi:hypothetical protein
LSRNRADELGTWIVQETLLCDRALDDETLARVTDVVGVTPEE